MKLTKPIKTQNIVNLTAAEFSSLGNTYAGYRVVIIDGSGDPTGVVYEPSGSTHTESATIAQVTEAVASSLTKYTIPGTGAQALTHANVNGAEVHAEAGITSVTMAQTDFSSGGFPVTGSFWLFNYTGFNLPVTISGFVGGISEDGDVSNDLSGPGTLVTVPHAKKALIIYDVDSFVRATLLGVEVTQTELDAGLATKQSKTVAIANLTEPTLAMSAGYPTDTVARTFTHTAPLLLEGVTASSFSGVVINGTSVTDGLTAQYIANTLNTSVAGQRTAWFGVVDGGFTKTVKAKFVQNGNNVDITLLEASFWSGNVLASASWTTTGGEPAGKSAGTIASSNAATGYGLESLSVKFFDLSGVKAQLDTKAGTAVATTTTNGLLSSTDKTKLDGVATNANNYVHPNHTGDVTSTADGATVIAADAVTNAKLADAAANTLKGNATAAAANPTDIAIAANRVLGRKSTGDISAQTVTDAAWNLLDDADAATMLTTLGAAGADKSGDITAATAGLDSESGTLTSPTVRVVVDSSALTIPGSAVVKKVRVTFVASASGLVISNAYIGIKAVSGDVYDFATTPVQLTFSGATTTTLAASATATSDYVSLTVNQGDSIVIAYKSTTGVYRKRTTVTGWRGFYKNSVDEASTVNATGYTEWENSIGVNLVEVKDSVMYASDLSRKADTTGETFTGDVQSTTSVIVDDSGATRFGIVKQSGSLPELRYMTGNGIKVRRVTTGTLQVPTASVEEVEFGATGGLLVGGAQVGTAVSASVKQTAGQNIPNAAYTVLNFDAENYDSNALHDNTTNNSRLTANKAGKWLITGACQVTVAGASTFALKVDKNGTTEIGINSGASSDIGGNVVTVAELAANDYVTIAVYQNTGSAVSTVISRTNFTMTFLGS